MRTFEEWLAINGRGFTQREIEITRACWIDAQFALNSELGIAANEAAKTERRKVATVVIVHDLPRYINRSTPVLADWLDAIIKEAQG